MSKADMSKFDAYNVYLDGKLIDTVYYSKACSCAVVRESLIEHDGYDPSIVVHLRMY